MLKDAGIETARLDAEVMLAHAAGMPRLELLGSSVQSIDVKTAAKFRDMVNRRRTFEPVAYITGLAEFWSLDFCVTPDVLIPRADSEILVEAALELLPKHQASKLADLGTGSGCLSLSILSERLQLHAYAIDVSKAATQVAQLNADRLGLAPRAAIAAAPMETWLGSASGFDMIISNPPYISQAGHAALAPDVKLYEPSGALVGGEDGLDFYRFIAKHSGQAITQEGSVLVEIGHDQREAVFAFFEQGFRRVDCRKDLAGRDRVVIARGPRYRPL